MMTYIRGLIRDPWILHYVSQCIMGHTKSRKQAITMFAGLRKHNPTHREDIPWLISLL